MARKPKRAVGKSRKTKSDSLIKEVHEIAGQAILAKRKSGNLAQRSAVIHREADKIHHGAETLHSSMKKTHEAIRNIGKTRPQTTRRKEKPQKDEPLLVVGVGASAGGFEAFVELLQYLPSDTGMAFVLVQHLDPTHESKLAPLLAHS